MRVAGRFIDALGLKYTTSEHAKVINQIWSVDRRREFFEAQLKKKAKLKAERAAKLKPINVLSTSDPKKPARNPFVKTGRTVVCWRVASGSVPPYGRTLDGFRWIRFRKRFTGSNIYKIGWGGRLLFTRYIFRGYEDTTSPSYHAWLEKQKPLS